MPRVELRPPAARDVSRIIEDLGRQSPPAAERIAGEIDQAAALIAQYPRAGRLVYPTRDVEYRSVVVGSYLLWYRIESTDVVGILALRHGRQRPPTLAQLEERAEEQP